MTTSERSLGILEVTVWVLPSAKEQKMRCVKLESVGGWVVLTSSLGELCVVVVLPAEDLLLLGEGDVGHVVANFLVDFISGKSFVPVDGRRKKKKKKYNCAKVKPGKRTRTHSQGNSPKLKGRTFPGSRVALA